MIRHHVLAAIARGIAADNDVAAREALGAIDPVARGFARRRLARALIDAELEAMDAGLAQPPCSHVLRLAALRVARRPAPPAGDVEAVAAAYGVLPAPRAGRVPVLTIAAAVVALAIVGAGAFAIITRPGPASRSYVRPLPPPSASAYKTGGTPLRDPAIERRFTDELTRLVVDSSRGLDTSAALGALRGASLGHGAALDQSWQGALDAFARAVAVRRTREPSQHDHDELREAVRELTEQLGNAGLGYFLEGRITSIAALIQAYRVEEVAFVTAAGAPRRVLSLRRLDRLNLAYAALGLHNADVGDPVLHLERIDEYVATTELPVLAPGARYPLAEDTWLATPEGKALAAAIGESVRREYATALDRDAAAAAKIATLLAERAGIIEQWRDHLERRRIVFSATDDLFVSKTLLDALADVVPHYQHERVEAIDDALAELEAPRIHARVHDLVAASVRRHEAQHGFDFDRDAELRYPQELVALVGAPRDSEGDAIPIAASARAELSGYLSQIINDPVAPHAALGHLAVHTFSRSRAGTGEFFAGIVVLEGLAHQLGIEARGPRWQQGLDRERLAKLALAVVTLSDDKLRTVAKALWLQLFGEPCTSIVDGNRG